MILWFCDMQLEPHILYEGAWGIIHNFLFNFQLVRVRTPADFYELEYMPKSVLLASMLFVNASWCRLINTPTFSIYLSEKSMAKYAHSTMGLSILYTKINVNKIFTVELMQMLKCTIRCSWIYCATTLVCGRDCTCSQDILSAVL